MSEIEEFLASIKFTDIGLRFVGTKLVVEDNSYTYYTISDNEICKIIDKIKELWVIKNE